MKPTKLNLSEYNDTAMNDIIDIRVLPDNEPFDLELVDAVEMEGKLDYVGPHRHKYYEIFWVLTGEGSHSIDFIEYPLIPDRVYFMAPGQVHEAHSIADTMFALSFNPDFVNPDYRSQLAVERIFSQNSASGPFVILDDTGRRELKQLLDIMMRERQAENPDHEMLSALLTGFMRYLMRYSPDQGESASESDQRMVKLMSLIEDHYKGHKDTSFYADKLALSSKRVNELTRAHFSKTVTQLIHDRIMLEAKRDLAYTNKTVKAIALDLGIEDVTYFSRFFRRNEGESPKAFRDKMFK